MPAKRKASDNLPQLGIGFTRIYVSHRPEDDDTASKIEDQIKWLLAVSVFSSKKSIVEQPFQDLLTRYKLSQQTRLVVVGDVPLSPAARQ
jgi:hypothetical protein